MDKMHDGAGTEMPAQDNALGALATLLEEIGDQAGMAFVRNGAGDEETFADCTRRVEAIVHCIISLPALTLHGASAKATAVRTRSAMVLLERGLVDALACDMHADVVRLRASVEVAGHA